MELNTLINRRVYLGNIIGQEILSNYNKIALIYEDNVLNKVFTASIESAFLSSTSGRFLNIPIANQNQVSLSVVKLKDFSPQALIMIFGGGENEDHTQKLCKALCIELYNKDFHADILFDGVHMDKEMLLEHTKETSIYYFFQENNIYLFTIDPHEGIVILHNIVPSGNSSFETYSVAEFPITFDHGKLLRSEKG